MPLAALLVVLHGLEESKLLNYLLSEVLATFVCLVNYLDHGHDGMCGPGPWLKIVSLSQTDILSSYVLCCGYAL